MTVEALLWNAVVSPSYVCCISWFLLFFHFPRFSQSGFFGKMYPGGYTAEVTSLSPKATEEDVYNFFGHCGAVEHVEIIRYNSSSPASNY